MGNPSSPIPRSRLLQKKKKQFRAAFTNLWVVTHHWDNFLGLDFAWQQAKAIAAMWAPQGSLPLASGLYQGLFLTWKAFSILHENGLQASQSLLDTGNPPPPTEVGTPGCPQHRNCCSTVRHHPCPRPHLSQHLQWSQRPGKTFGTADLEKTFKKPSKIKK